MESYTDDKNDNKWKTVNRLIDSGHWYANNIDKIIMVLVATDEKTIYLDIQYR